VKSADSTGGHVSKAIEDLTVVLPVRADFDEAELDDLTRRANWEKKRASNTCKVQKGKERGQRGRHGHTHVM
jgi:hypothetical protein